MLVRKLYYLVKPLIPRSLQLSLRRARIRLLRDRYTESWPIYAPAAKGLASGTIWPNGKRFALVLTHDVESETGHDRCRQLMQLEKQLGFRSAFYFVPERYKTNPELREHLTSKGFEVGVHGLTHDGKLYNNEVLFNQRVQAINDYLSRWGVCGFASPCAHHNLEWTSDLNIKYAVTTYDTDPFEPQTCGIGTVFPFYVRNVKTGRGYLEIPYTLPQDFSLYILMRERNIEIWKRKVDWIAEVGGMVHIKTHPDYMSMDGKTPGMEEYPVSYYSDLLQYIQSKYSGQFWHVSPAELADFYYENADETPLQQSNGETLCFGCRAAFRDNIIQVFGVS